ncbi:Yop protein translocation protein D [compost metagenome]
MAWKIRFFSGLNQGIEAPLPDGRVVIGSDPAAADLVVVDPGIASVHLVLEVSAQQVCVVEWAEGNIATQDGETMTAGSDLQAFLVQGCGPLRWAFCAQAQHFDRPLQRLTPVTRQPTKGALPKRTLGFAALGCAVLVVVMLAFFSLGTDADRSVDTPAPALAVRSYLQQQQLTDVVIGAAQPGASVVLSGYLQSNEQRAALQRFMEASDSSFRLDVRTQEDIRKDVDSILPKLGYPGAHSVDGSKVGWVRLIDAQVQDPARWQQALQTLKSDVQGLQGVEAPAKPALTPLQKLQQLLDAAGLAGQLTIGESENWIELSGTLDDRQLDSFQAVQRQYSSAFKTPPELRLKNNADKKKPVSVQFPIKAVSIGRVPYVILSDNRRYPVGGLTPTGVRVVDIQSNQVIVSQQAQQFIINLRGDASSDQ